VNSSASQRALQVKKKATGPQSIHIPDSTDITSYSLFNIYFLHRYKEKNISLWFEYGCKTINKLLIAKIDHLRLPNQAYLEILTEFLFSVVLLAR
jgi:hypothetical protein